MASTPDPSKRFGPPGPSDEASNGAAAPGGVNEPLYENTKGTGHNTRNDLRNRSLPDFGEMMIGPGPCTFSMQSHGCCIFYEEGRAAVIDAEGIRRRGEMFELCSSEEMCQLAVTVCLDGIDDAEYRRNILLDLKVKFSIY